MRTYQTNILPTIRIRGLAIACCKLFALFFFPLESPAGLAGEEHGVIAEKARSSIAIKDSITLDDASPSLSLTTASASSEFAATACRANPSVTSEIFELSTRHLPEQFCSIDENNPPLDVHRWEATRWQRSDLDQALTYEDKPTIIYVHGNFMERNNTLERARILDSYLKTQSNENYRLLLFSWPSQRERKPLRDIYENDETAEDHSLYLAWILRQLRSQSRVSVLGFSFGARCVTAALHLDAGGNIPGLRFGNQQTESVQRVPYHLGLIAPAVDKNWLLPNGRYGKATSNINDFVNMYNSRDPVLRRYKFIDRLSRPIAGGLVGFDGIGDPRATSPLAGQIKVKQYNCGGVIGTTHSEKSYFGECPYFRVMIDHLLWNQDPNEPSNSDASCR
jgi:pimeloyl-ACP methyl ester carboxylesterase